MDDFGTTSRSRRLGDDPMGFSAPMASRAFLGQIIDAITGGSKGRANQYQKLFEEQKDYSRGRGTLLEQFLAQDRKAGDLAMRNMRGLANRQLNNTGQYLNDRVGMVQNQINQVGQAARQDILDQGRQAGASTAANLQRRGLGSSTMLAGAQAQNQAATQRATSALAEGIAGLRGGALERTTGDVADFYKFRSQYAPGLLRDQIDFNRQGALAGAAVNQQNTAMDNQLLMNLINAAVGGKGVNSGLVSNAFNSGENLLAAFLLGG